MIAHLQPSNAPEATTSYANRESETWLCPQRVSDASNGVNEWRAKAAIDLVAQIVDVDIDDIAGEVPIVLPDVIKDLVTAEHLPLVPEQQFKQLKFLDRELDPCPRGWRYAAQCRA